MEPLFYVLYFFSKALGTDIGQFLDKPSMTLNVLLTFHPQQEISSAVLYKKRHPLPSDRLVQPTTSSIE